MPCKAILARSGLTIPPCGVPVSCEWYYTLLSTYPAFNHSLISLLPGKFPIVESNCSWLMLSKHPEISASTTHFFFLFGRTAA